MVSSERSSLDLSEFTLFQIQNIICNYKNQIIGENLTFLGFFFSILLLDWIGIFEYAPRSLRKI